MDLLTGRVRLDYNSDDRAMPAAELAARLADCDGLVSLVHDKINDELLSAAPKLKVVSNNAVGYDNFDLPAMTRHGVMATHTPGVLTDTTADLAFALLMAAARRLGEADRYVRAGQFKVWSVDLLLGMDVHHATLGLLGFGRIGRGMARRAHGFDMRVIYFDEYRATPEIEKQYGVEYADKETVIRQADFLSIHVPLQAGTRHLIGRTELEMMKPTAILVNSSRGPVVDEAALAAALKNGVIAGAGLDVFEFEPKVDPGMMELPNVVLAPHIGSATKATRTAMAKLAVENCLAALEGKTPPNLLNKDVVPRS
jgi:lactate dehydrogenase-like 2-hydroxyacid dehydrogenase